MLDLAAHGSINEFKMDFTSTAALSDMYQEQIEKTENSLHAVRTLQAASVCSILRVSSIDPSEEHRGDTIFIDLACKTL